MRRKRIFAGAVLLALACGQGGELSPAEQGQRIYVANCTVCHNPNPAVDGMLGPAVAGSSRELIEARLLRAEYPPGHAPKRPTQQMVAMPYLEPYVDVLAAYLAGREEPDPRLRLGSAPSLELEQDGRQHEQNHR